LRGYCHDVGTILSTRLGALLAGALSMGAGSTYRCSRSLSCCSRPQPTPQSTVAASGCGRIRARADLGVRERPTHPRIHTAPAAELLSKVTAIGHLPEQWREVVRIAQGIGQSCTREVGNLQVVWAAPVLLASASTRSTVVACCAPLPDYWSIS
jgi:hypothetical protein